MNTTKTRAMCSHTESTKLYSRCERCTYPMRPIPERPIMYDSKYVRRADLRVGTFKNIRRIPTFGRFLRAFMALNPHHPFHYQGKLNWEPRQQSGFVAEPLGEAYAFGS